MVMLIINAVTEEMFEFWFVCQLAYRKTTFLKLCGGVAWSKEEPMKSLNPRSSSKNRCTNYFSLSVTLHLALVAAVTTPRSAS